MVETTLIHHFLENSARRYPDKIALVHEEVRATYVDINSQANQLARYLVDSGVCPGGRVVLLLENSLDYVVAYYAALKAGAIAVPLNTEWKADSLLPVLQELESSVLLTSRKFERLLKTLDLSATHIQQVIIKNPKLGINEKIEASNWDEVISTYATSNLNLIVQPGNMGSIIYTSGSTGKAKGVMLTHGNIVANVKSICRYLKLTSDDIQMVVQPFFYVMGKSLLNTHIAVGGRLVINNKFAYPATVIKQMIDERVTGFSGVPSTYAHLLHQSPLAASRDQLTALRYCSQAGGHMAGSVKLKLLESLPEQTQLFIMYGATEASARLAYVEPQILKEKLDSIGKAIPGVTLKILDKQGKEVSTGEIGEIVASGDNITSGYWKDAEATARALDSHGYHTGDLGYQDEDGYIYVTGRRDNQLKVSGHRVNTQEIEDAILATDFVVEAAVIGIPDPLLENKLIAVVVAKENPLDEKQLIQAVVAKLAAYKLPQQWIQVANLPKSASGKVDRKRCEELIS